MKEENEYRVRDQPHMYILKNITLQDKISLLNSVDDAVGNTELHELEKNLLQSYKN